MRYAHASFTVDATWLVPLNEAGGLVLLDVTTTEPLTVYVKFRPDLKPMWPAALGGQYSYWDDTLKAYVIGEGSGKNAALIGSPLGLTPPEQPAHNLPDAPVAVRDPHHAGDGGEGPRADRHHGERREARRGEEDLRGAARLARGALPRVGRALPGAAGRDDQHRVARPPVRPGVRVGQGGARQGLRLQPAPRVRPHRGPRAVRHDRAPRLRLVLRRRHVHQRVGDLGVRRPRHRPAVARVPAQAAARRRQDDARAVAGRRLHPLVRGLRVRLLPRRHDAALHRRGPRLRAGERRRGVREGLLAVDAEGVRLLRLDRRGRRRPDGQHQGRSWARSRPGRSAAATS